MNDATDLNGVGGGGWRRPLDPFAFFYLFVFIQVSLVAVWVGLRPPNIGTDTANYLSFYNDVLSCQCMPGEFEVGFEVVAYLFALFDSGSAAFLCSLSLLNFILVLWVSSKAARYYSSGRDSRKFILVVMAAFLVSPFFLNSQINIIRQGLSALFLFHAVFDMRNGRTLRVLVWSLLSLSFHFTAALSLLSLFLLLLGRRVVLASTVMMFLAYASGGTEAFVIYFSNVSGLDIYSRISGYAAGAEYKAGVRLDFAAFSIAIPVLAKLAGHFQRSYSEYIDWAVGVYLSILMPFWFFGWANYSDRFAFTAWLFASIALSIGLMPLVRKLSLGVVIVPSLLSFFVFWGYLISK